MSDLSLSDDNELQVQGVLRFSKIKREQHVKEIVTCVADYKDLHLTPNNLYNTNEVEHLFDEVKTELTEVATKEIEHAYHTSALLVKVLLSQAQEAGVQLTIDTNLLENEMLLKQVKNSETAALARPASDFSRKAGQLSKIGTVATVNVADPQVVKDRDALKEEVAALKERLEKLQASTSSMMKEKNEQLDKLRSQLDAKDAEVAAAKSAAAARPAFDTPAPAAKQDDTSKAMIAEFQLQLNSQAAQLEKVKKERAEMEAKLSGMSAQLKALNDSLDGKLNESKQFVTMKKMMQQKSQEVVLLKRRLAKFEPDGAPADEEDNKVVERDFDDD